MARKRALLAMIPDDNNMFFFSGLALFHSIWIGWLAPVGFLILIKSRGFQKVYHRLHKATMVASSVALGVGIGCMDGMLLQTVPSVGTALLMTVGLTFLGYATSLSDREAHERWGIGLHGLLSTSWSITFLTIRYLEMYL
ncbi:MAG: hypothetical protein KatS3mg017_0479 [Fimbriimonadales bacterium]|nr:MAG: hypothetical protein KatS3mg017_0479 [Fimbriimonadales bacterium]